MLLLDSGTPDFFRQAEDFFIELGRRGQVPLFLHLLGLQQRLLQNNGGFLPPQGLLLRREEQIGLAGQGTGGLRRRHRGHRERRGRRAVHRIEGRGGRDRIGRGRGAGGICRILRPPAGRHEQPGQQQGGEQGGKQLRRGSGDGCKHRRRLTVRGETAEWFVAAWMEPAG